MRRRARGAGRTGSGAAAAGALAKKRRLVRQRRAFEGGGASTMKRCAAEPDDDVPALKRARRAVEAAAADRQAYAAERGGEYLGALVALSATMGERVRRRCAAGHEWSTGWACCKRSGSWCAKCARADRAPARDYSPDALRALAAANGGECLEPDAPGGGSAVRRWRCGFAHEWKASACSIASKATWCPRCAGNTRLGLDAMRELAAARGGECLSATYTNVTTPLRWRCALGHEWEACAGNVKNGRTWCPRCACAARQSDAAVRELAAAHGGECLSAEYVNTRSPLRWRCALGHTWEATAEAVKNRQRWCPHCD